MPPKTRSYDPVKVRTALAAQVGALRAAVHELCAGPDAERRLARPTRLGEWRVRELVAHLALQIEWVPRHVQEPLRGAPDLSLAQWVAGVGTVAPLLDAGTREYTAKAFDGTPAEVAAAFDAAAQALIALLVGPEVADPARRFEIRLGSMPLSDMLVTRLVETVVHADDLADALGLPGFAHDRQAVAAVVRLLADALAAQAPGGAVELRVPPYAVVQAVEGPRHTRGTPPNVVETDPLTWIRLATGRIGWAAAVEDALVSASGERSDLSGHLPVLN
ncbi:sterol carrier family protein [Kitasatospora sp. NBC_00240]|uniref:sterol carrier family protein n=1 Tax=Kitasatospora sp. NBC_00240 TaxID=2903567 RepID=UPI00224EBF8B|nr:sterol carrier family protein [Kitasatospora sp. NBC_00240]MCX5211817.1 sterol carrier family protein [Kitasatospora sp. NBC_00240]